MSRTLYKYIEVRKDGEWKHFKTYSPVSGYNVYPEEEIVKLGDEDYHCMHVFNDGACMRDMLNVFGLCDKLSIRGFPKDVTDEVRKDIEENGGYSVTYATVSDFEEEINERLAKWKANLVDALNKKSNREVLKRLDIIESLLRNKDSKSEEFTNDNEDNDYLDDYIHDLLGDELLDIMYAMVEVEHLYRMVTAHTKVSEDDVRIVCVFG